MTVKVIVLKYLEDNGYDGLGCEHCSCLVEDLMPCDTFGNYIGGCEPGYNIPCPGHEGGCDFGNCKFHITTEDSD